jgi:oxygen-dependent protoporphyrinogen oxidase
LPALIHTPKTSPSAKNRFLYLSPSPTSTLPSGIVQLPSSFLSLLGSSVGRRLLLPAAAQEPFRWGNRPRDTAGHTVEDESFDAFCTRRFGPQFASTMASALVHGIYAADSRKLSVRAAFPSLWNAEQRGGGSVVRGMLVGMLGHTSTKESVLPYQLGNVKETLRDASVFSFRNGIEDITQALVAHLKRQANVRLHTEADIRSIAYDKSSSGFEVKLCFPPLR